MTYDQKILRIKEDSKPAFEASTHVKAYFGDSPMTLREKLEIRLKNRLIDSLESAFGNNLTDLQSEIIDLFEKNIIKETYREIEETCNDVDISIEY